MVQASKKSYINRHKGKFDNKMKKKHDLNTGPRGHHIVGNPKAVQTWPVPINNWTKLVDCYVFHLSICVCMRPSDK